MIIPRIRLCRAITLPTVGCASPILGWLIATLLYAAPLGAQVTVATHRYDGARVGANLSETALTPQKVSVNTFGKLYSYPVDGSVYAQPLYVPGLTIGGVARNVLFVATMNDKVYAFDADSTSGSPLWMRDFTNPPSVTAVPITDIVPPNKNIVGNVGIHGTPVIDTASGTIYLVARTKENGAYVQRLHALDITTGASRAGSPVTITASAAGNAPDATPGVNGPTVTFNPKMQSQRAALALSNGVVLIAWAGHEDVAPWHGWIMGYDAATLAQVGTFCVTPDAYGGGVWQGGRAPTLDSAGNAYFATGNGRWDGTRNFGNSLLKFTVSRAGLTLVDYFTPGNYQALDAADDDLSGSGFTLLPGTSRLLGGGKEGVLYLLDAPSLGGMTPDDSQIPQRIPETGGHVMGGAVYWNSGAAGPVVYNWSEDDVLRAYRLSAGKLSVPSFAQGAVLSPGHPGGSLTVSANGSAAGSGIIWASMPTIQDGIHGLVAGVMRAFNAETLAEIWNSEQNPGRDRVGTLMKFVPPLVVEGRVYMPSHDNSVAVYGLLPSSPDATPGTISVDFLGSHTVAMDASETAGVVPARNWNAAFGSSASSVPLVNASGALTSASLTYSAPSGTWQLPTVDQPGSARMMKGYLDTGNSSRTTVTVTGLPQASYDVYVYVDGDNKSTERSAAYTISGPGIVTQTISLTDAAATNFAGTFVRADGSAGNYVRFTVDASSFTLDAAPIAPELSRRAPINGIQIVPRVVVQPADFTLSATPTSRTVTAGSAVTYTVSVGAVNGFTGTVSLSASGLPSGATATFTPASIAGSGNSTLTIATTSATPQGTSSIVVTGTSGSLSHSTTVTLVVERPVTTTAGTISIDFIGTSGVQMDVSETAGVIAKSHWNAAGGTASSAPLPLIDESGAATNATVTWSAPGGMWALPIADAPGDVRMMHGYLDTSNTTTTRVTVAGLAQGSYDVYVYADGDNKTVDRSAAYTISGTGIATQTIALTDPANTNFAGAFTRADGTPGNYVRFTIDATGFTLDAAPTTPVDATRRAPINGIQIVPRAPVLPPDFTLSASPSSRTVTAGSAATYTVTTGAVNGFTGTVSLSASGLPSGATATFTPASIAGSGSATLTIATSSATPAGTSSVTVTGTSGSLSHSTTVTLVVERPATIGTGAISIDFVGTSGVQMDPAETAGVIAKSHWNAAAGTASSAALPLVDESGLATNATVTWSAPGGMWALPITDAPGDVRMMRGYLDTSNTTTTTVTVAGLPQGTYDVYVYVDGDNKTVDRSAAYTFSGPGIATTTVNMTDAANVNFGGAFTRADNSAGNYIRFSINSTGFTLVAAPTTPTDATRRAPINGIQIVRTSTPPPQPALPIGIDFNGSSTSVMAPDESAGVVPQTHWNSAPGGVRTAPLALADAAGAATSATVTWTANGGWMVPITDSPGNFRLMQGYLDTSSTSSTTVTVSGLRAGSYDVYVYADGDNRSFTRSASYRLSVPGSPDSTIGLTDPADTNFSGTFAPAAGGPGNYVKFTITGDSVTLVATPATSTNTSLRAPINAVQIVPR